MGQESQAWRSEPAKTGPDGALWFTNGDTGGSEVGGSVGRITTGGVVAAFAGAGISGPQGIASGPDGALWFTNGSATNGSIGRITTSGAVTDSPSSVLTYLRAITAGPDGAMWFTEGPDAIGSIATG